MPANKKAFEDSEDGNRFAALCFYNRSYSYLIKHRYNEALSDINMAIASYPDYHDALVNRSKLYELMRRPDLAKKDKDRAAEIIVEQKTNPYFGR